MVNAAAGEECDNGGICIGGTNAGTVCDAESDCQGEGVCTEGPKVGTACSSDANCPNAKCIHCKPFGGDGCAANCTNETDIPYKLIPGAPKVCDAASAAKTGNACSADADCAPGKCVFIKLCLGGQNDGLPCANNTQCPGGQCLNQFKPGTTGSFVHDGFIQLALPLTGKQVSTVGKLLNGKVTSVIKATASKIDRVSVGALACACVRSVEARSCGGTLFDADGAISADCTPGFTAGDSVCAGKKPCAYVHGPGNSSSGVIGCGGEGLSGINLVFTQDAGLSPVPYPPPATPPPGSKPPVIVLSGTGPAGSGIVLNSSAIGTATGTVRQRRGEGGVGSRPDLLYGRRSAVEPRDPVDAAAGDGERVGDDHQYQPEHATGAEQQADRAVRVLRHSVQLCQAGALPTDTGGRGGGRGVHVAEPAHHKRHRGAQRVPPGTAMPDEPLPVSGHCGVVTEAVKNCLDKGQDAPLVEGYSEEFGYRVSWRAR